ncbi:hypothetical protein JW935_06610 [candidate division KSB1 bacterium]|nr:hypothetical protein [candidate division KSB1 bacterium]
MSADSYTRVTHQSWFSRIGGAFKGIFVGLLFVVGALFLLFWNEGRAVKRYKTLKEGAGIVISVPADNVTTANAGKLIHVTGMAETNEILTDPVFGVSANAIKLERIVEMYQWQEEKESTTRKKVGGGTETVTKYTYRKGWSDKPIKSSDFDTPQGHENPPFKYESSEITANKVSLGAFTLSPSLVRKIGQYTTLPVKPGSRIPREPWARVYGEGFYIGANPSSPQLGDIRVQFKVVKPTQVSVIAAQQGETFSPYQTKNGSIEELSLGTLSADVMFQQAQQSNKMMTWVLRCVGFFLMFLGLNMILKPLSVIADVLPILGRIVSAGSGMISFLLAAVFSLLTIAMAWLFYRPLIGLALVAIVVVLILAVRGKLKKASPVAVRSKKA